MRRRLIREWKKRARKVDVEIRGLRYRLDIVNNTTDAKILTSSQVYDGKELEWLGQVAGPEAVFFDVGANTGYYSLAMMQRGFGKVVAIEPNPPTLKLLTANVGLNDRAGVVQIMPYCVGPDGVVPLYSSTGLGSASVISDGSVATHEVQSMPLLDIARLAGVSRIDGMKVDVEGFEVSALKPFFEDAPREFFPKVMVLEDCHADAWGFDLIGFICGLGYVRAGKTRGNLILKRQD